MKCIDCGSDKLSRERRMNGNDICGNCGLTYPSRLTNMIQNRIKQTAREIIEIVKLGGSVDKRVEEIKKRYSV